MRKFFGVLRYVKGYWRYAIWNIIFNILSVIFSLFSIALMFPFLKVLFSNDPNQISDIIVKGGDYCAETIIGAEYCKDVKIFNYIQNKSTSLVVSKIKNKPI